MAYPHAVNVVGDPVPYALIQGLANLGRAVITFDPPGAGRSTRPKHLTMEEMLDCAPGRRSKKMGPMKSRSHSRANGKKQREQLILHGRMRRDRLGIGLLTVSAAGIGLNGIVFPRLARTGGFLQQVSTGILFGRVVVFTVTGMPHRQRPLPRFLTFVELITDGVATAMGFATWIWPGYFRRSDAGRVASLSRIISTVTFALHTMRVAIYLTPNRGLRHDVSVRDQPASSRAMRSRAKHQSNGK